MASIEEPTRWSDLASDSAEALPDGLRADLVDYTELGPSGEQAARMLATITTSPPKPELSGLRSPWKWSAALLASMMLMGALWWGLKPDEKTANTQKTKLEATPIVTSRAVPVVLREEPAPSPAPSAAEPASSPPKTRASEVRPVAMDPAAELAILTRARRLLSAAPAQALLLTDEHRSLYPKGTFLEEREVLAIEALMKAAREPEAHARGQAFLKAHPRSAHAERVRVVLTEPNPR